MKIFTSAHFFDRTVNLRFRSEKKNIQQFKTCMFPKPNNSFLQKLRGSRDAEKIPICFHLKIPPVFLIKPLISDLAQQFSRKSMFPKKRAKFLQLHF